VIRVTKDGRTIRTAKDYTAFRHALWEVNHGNCWKCERRTNLVAHPSADNSFHVHHKGGRGLGGSKRDDTFLKCSGLCGFCHRGLHKQGCSGVPQWSRA
jgi:hypothetical protein